MIIPTYLQAEKRSGRTDASCPSPHPRIDYTLIPKYLDMLIFAQGSPYEGASLLLNGEWCIQLPLGLFEVS
ncbi:MAG: hypothetical protein U9Q78_05865, partial [Chloroflexota bacterium]|nr:hypothetical protein [Chloroflexota bacterium]